jgi:hypothetical protein
MKRGKPPAPPPCASPAPALPTSADWLARIAALDSEEPRPASRRPRPRTRRHVAVNVVAALVLSALLAVAVVVAVQLLWVK